LNRPRVALDARLTRQMSVGMQTYVRELVGRLPVAAPDLHFVVITNADLDSAGAEILRISDRSAANVSFGEYVILPRLLTRGADLVHLMSLYSPLRVRAPHVQTIHDLIHRRFPEYFSWKIPLYYRWVTGPVARSARTVITDARATIPDLRSYLNIDAKNIKVIPLGVKPVFFLDDEQRARTATRARERFALQRPFVLYAGNARRHKNLETLFAAWSRIELECDLCITSTEALAFDADRYASARGRIVRLGHVEESDLVSLYAGAAAVVQPSLYEGFGLSVVEAMAAGAPVIVARTPALIEVAGDAALSFAPTDHVGLTQALAAALSGHQPIAALVAAGRRRAAIYTWERAAEMTAGVYREALAR
jgi:glycosyltransferase involved in cell wall biosynthesis